MSSDTLAFPVFYKSSLSFYFQVVLWYVRGPMDVGSWMGWQALCTRIVNITLATLLSTSIQIGSNPTYDAHKNDFFVMKTKTNILMLYSFTTVHILVHIHQNSQEKFDEQFLANIAMIFTYLWPYRKRLKKVFVTINCLWPLRTLTASSPQFLLIYFIATQIFNCN